MKNDHWVDRVFYAFLALVLLAVFAFGMAVTRPQETPLAAPITVYSTIRQDECAGCGRTVLIMVPGQEAYGFCQACINKEFDWYEKYHRKVY